MGGCNNQTIKMLQQILKLKYFHSIIVKSLSEKFTDIASADVTLVSDDQIPFQAHLFVLSASSPVLKDLLLDNPSSHPLIYLRGVKQQELVSILQFMYFGKTQFNQNGIKRFLDIGRDSQMKQLDVTRKNLDGYVCSDKNAKNNKFFHNEYVAEYESTKDVLSIQTYGSDFVDLLHKCGECGAGYEIKDVLMRH